MRKLLLTGFSAVALMFSAAPSHAVLTIVGGVAGTTPATNDVIGVTAGFFGAKLFATPGTYEYTFVGAEAAFFNDFLTTSGTFNNETSTPGASFRHVHVETFLFGLALDFAFDIAPMVFPPIFRLENLANVVPDGIHPNFFLGAAPGGGIWIALDDTGAGPDDNHDDLVVLVREIIGVPEPASLALFGAALAGLSFVRRRRTASRLSVG